MTEQGPDGIPEEYYDECADPRCTHYRCEHDIRFGKLVYVAPGCEGLAREFENSWCPGCANADCPCEKFKESK